MPPASIERPSYSPRTIGSSSSLDVCMENAPFVGDDRRHGVAALVEKQEAGSADRGGSEAGEEQRGAGAEGADDEPAEHERTELGAVARPVVGREDAAAERLGRALVDQRA